MIDISTHKESESLLARMGQIFQHSWNEIYTFDSDSLLFIEVSRGARENLGYSHEELRQLTPLDLKPEYTFDQFEALISPLRRLEKQQVCFETEHRRKDGSKYPIEVRLQLSDTEKPHVFIAIIQDISERKQYINELERRALFDSLTELPNRALLQDRLNHCLQVSKRSTSPLSVMIINLLRLKEINSLLGHHSGDLVIKEVAARVKNVLRESDTVARMDGGKFTVILPSATTKQAEVIARKIQEVLEKPLVLVDMPVEMEVAIGIAQYPEHGDSTEILLRHADIAVRSAKNEPSYLSLYNVEDDPFSVRRLRLQAEIRRAISDKEIIVHYQPKIDVRTGNVASVEALARWPHPSEGMISPADFIPTVEQSGLIRPFTLLILEHAIQQLKLWSKDNIDLTVSVNLSTRNLLDITLPDSIASLMDLHQVHHSRLTLEITESVIMSRPERSLKTLNQLHALGFNLSIDDFGKDHSSLTYLKSLPATELKIDRSFISAMSDSEQDKQIVRSTIDLAHNLGLHVVAEGIEEPETLDLLRLYSCDYAQGFYFCRPLPPDELEHWLYSSPWGFDTQA